MYCVLLLLAHQTAVCLHATTAVHQPTLLQRCIASIVVVIMVWLDMEHVASEF